MKITFHNRTLYRSWTNIATLIPARGVLNSSVIELIGLIELNGARRLL
jgi:hypothetical protein